MKVEIANLEHPENCRTLDFVLDANAFQTVVPGEILVELGIKPYATDPLGRKKGPALFRYGECVGGGDIVFGEPDTPPVLGLVALGSLGFDIDRATGQLKLLPMILA